jgi:KDO2-lipid IV(A) lauroyltransferase
MWIWLGYLVADALVRLLPSVLTDALARAVGRLAFVLRVPARRRLERNLALAWGRDARERPRLAGQVFEQFGLAVADFLRLGHLSALALESRTELAGGEHFEAARRGGRGVILLSAHLGGWEWGAAFLAARGSRMRIAARPHDSARVERFFLRRRARWGIHLVTRGPGWVGAASALRRGECLGLMADRAVEEHRDSVCAFAAALARRTGAAILPVAMMRLDDGRQRLCIEPPLSPSECAAGRFATVMRRHVARAPAQWFAFEPLSEGWT